MTQLHLKLAIYVAGMYLLIQFPTQMGQLKIHITAKGLTFWVSMTPVHSLNPQS